MIASLLRYVHLNGMEGKEISSYCWWWKAPQMSVLWNYQDCLPSMGNFRNQVSYC